MLFTVSVSSSAESDHWIDYYKIGVGLVYFSDGTAKYQDLAGPGEFEFDSGRGYSYSLGIGKKITQWTYLELLYQATSTTTLSGSLYDEGSYYADGQMDLSSDSLILSALFDLTWFFEDSLPITPYAGLGFGVSNNYFEELHVDGTTAYIPKNKERDLAGRISLGIVFNLRHLPVLDVAYSYTHYGEFRSKDYGVNPGGQVAPLDPAYHFQARAHELNISALF